MNDEILTGNTTTIFLKKTEPWSLYIDDNKFDLRPIEDEGSKMNLEREILIRKLRLFKRGDIKCPVQFQIDKKTRKLSGKISFNKGHFGTNLQYSIKMKN